MMIAYHLTYSYSRIKLKFLVILSIILAFKADAQNLDTISLGNKISILQDKVLISLPQKAFIINSKVSSEGNDDSWISWELTGVKLLLFTQRLNPSNDNNLFEAVAKTDQLKLFKTKVLTDNSSLKTMLSTPLKLDSTQSAILINRVLVRLDDGTVFTISAFINQAGFKMKDQYRILTERSFTNLKVKAGNSDDSTLKGVMSVLSGKKDYAINLPLIAEAVNSLFRSKKNIKQ